MKKLLLLCVFAVFTLIANAQTDIRQTRPDFTQNPNATYRLFPTTNMWIFIKLNTADGRMWLVQYSTTAGDQVEIPLSRIERAEESEKKDGRFTLYATQNMYNFILLDQIDGRVWQVQWSTEGDNLVIPIL
ncbi:MAG: hypothetical protein SPF79_02390 [Bacteroidaceae bacterium]|nr:hypothetical protein [Bacteroidaceae bacterium]